ncbi:MAG TPA: sigma factor-like helix-turn-helix DNA-binding protein [Lysobacter sp.]
MANPKRNPEREAVICRLYQDGKTLQEVGDVFGLTRERVRQILRRAGVPPKAGGRAKRAQRRNAEATTRRRIERDARAQEVYGCYYDEALALNEGRTLSNAGTPARSYVEQRRNAAVRDIEWSITFPEWMFIWRDSGHLDERGKGIGFYCMARFHDIGPYEMGNVYITTCAGNVQDYQAELKRRGVECADGFKRLPERAALIKHD